MDVIISLNLLVTYRRPVTLGGMERRSRFDRLYRQYADRVMNYCLRHLSPSHAEDAVADTFLVAWRRIDDVPEPAIGWLIITARHTIFTRYRAQAKAQTLVERLARITRLAAEATDVTVVRREMLLTALNSLTEDEREALFLTAWDGLSGEDAAEVIGCRQGALRMRLYRARQKLSEALGEDSPAHIRSAT